MSSEESVDPKGFYKSWTIREVPDDEFIEQWALFDKEKSRRDAIESHEKELDEFVARHRELLGMHPIGCGEEWFDPDGDAFSSYPLGAVVEHEGKFYESIRHANMMDPTKKVWWEAYTPKPGEFDHDS